MLHLSLPAAGNIILWPGCRSDEAEVRACAMPSSEGISRKLSGLLLASRSREGVGCCESGRLFALGCWWLLKLDGDGTWCCRPEDDCQRLLDRWCNPCGL